MVDENENLVMKGYASSYESALNLANKLAKAFPKRDKSGRFVKNEVEELS